MKFSSGVEAALAAAVPLTCEEEQRLLEALFDGDRSAHGQLVQAKLPVVAETIRDMDLEGIFPDDLLQVGIIALCKVLNFERMPEEGELDGLVAEQVRAEVTDYAVHIGVQVRPKRLELPEALEMLEPLERAVLTMRFGLEGEPGLSQEETARRLGITEAEVSRRLRHGHRKLRKYL